MGARLLYVSAPDSDMPRDRATGSYAAPPKTPPVRTTLVVCECGLRHRHVRIATTTCPICNKTPVIVAASP